MMANAWMQDTCVDTEFWRHLVANIFILCISISITETSNEHSDIQQKWTWMFTNQEWLQLWISRRWFPYHALKSFAHIWIIFVNKFWNIIKFNYSTSSDFCFLHALHGCLYNFFRRTHGMKSNFDFYLSANNRNSSIHDVSIFTTYRVEWWNEQLSVFD